MCILCIIFIYYFVSNSFWILLGIHHNSFYYHKNSLFCLNQFRLNFNFYENLQMHFTLLNQSEKSRPGRFHLANCY